MNTVLKRDEIAILLVSLAQMVGLAFTVFGKGPVAAVMTGIAGFAAVVNYFLPHQLSADWFQKLKLIAAFCGVLLILMAFGQAM